MNSYEYLLKSADEQMGYSAQPRTKVMPSSAAPGAPALPPAPSVAPTTSAPPPSPKLGGLLGDVEQALMRRRLMHEAERAALAGASSAGDRYRSARNTALKSLGLHGLGAGLGGLAAYSAGKHLLHKMQPPQAPAQPSAEDFAEGSSG
jgi:hypothetical protein